MARAVFLDRDDTLIRCLDLPPEAWAGRRGDTADPRWVEALPGAIEACRRLVRAGYTLVVITNQGGVARGNVTLAQVAAVNARTRALFVADDGSPLIRACYACPFHPKAPDGPLHREHPWRKPAGGMIRAAARELGIDLAASWMIGDAVRDVEAGVDAGIATHRCRRLGPMDEGADAPDLATIADEILRAGPPSAASSTGTVRAHPMGAPSATPSAGAPRRAGAGVAVTLRALSGEPLADANVRDMVLSTAHAIAERTGVPLLHVDARLDRVTAEIATHRLAALGFGAELRRITERWHRQKHGAPLWNDPANDPPHD